VRVKRRGRGCDTLAAIYEPVYGKEAPMHMTACEEVIGLPGDGWRRSCCSMSCASN